MILRAYIYADNYYKASLNIKIWYNKSDIAAFITASIDACARDHRRPPTASVTHFTYSYISHGWWHCLNIFCHLSSHWFTCWLSIMDMSSSTFFWVQHPMICQLRCLYKPMTPHLTTTEPHWIECSPHTHQSGFLHTGVVPDTETHGQPNRTFIASTSTKKPFLHGMWHIGM